jgi:hypothetical protein
MNKAEKIKKINVVLTDYFSKHKGETVKAKEMMGDFVKAGIFTEDRKGGLPIRQLLRELDEENNLGLIPFVYAERKPVNTNWYFTDVPVSAKPIVAAPRKVRPKKEVADTLPPRRERDEDYIINLCDVILKQKALRQHRFEFLVGDTGVQLPVDAYYPELNLVIEYRERQHTESVKFWNKPTASGIPRDEQRARYDQRRREVLPKHGIKLVELSYSDFEHSSNKRLLRIEENDIQVIRKILSI